LLRLETRGENHVVVATRPSNAWLRVDGIGFVLFLFFVLVNCVILLARENLAQ
jgi:hypothetical protein